MKDSRIKIINKKHIVTVTLVLVLGLIIYPFLSSYIEYMQSRIINEHRAEFQNNLLRSIKDQTTFVMKDITPFQWDELHIFYPYTTRTEMEERLGTTWTTATSYFSYLIESKNFLGEYPLDNDLFHKLVFLDDGSVVLDITLDRMQVDFTRNKELVLSNCTGTERITENK
ncbi:hypothetical protein [Bacillus horti]|uniref:Uncharacterized protein n=1 Tax=Caldalkalibacillus horti TaxID=77523 RepID=A0ABT9VXN5_9BACI|nr:hypothetical protein [Bacillus horti]MDQ0165760.1 hypothetical protein [Bacillus horti]